jgi:flagellar basal body-associated protein FliL
MSDKAPPTAAADNQPATTAGDDKKAGKSDGNAKAAKGGKGKSLLSKTPVLIAGVMVLEGVFLFAGMKVLGGGPKNVHAEVTLDGNGTAAGEAHGGEARAGSGPLKTVELAVCELRAPNKQSGRTFLYDVSIFAVVGAEHQDKVKELFSARDALIKDRVRTIIAELDPEKLSGGSEPGLETLRRQVKFQLDQIVGDGMVDEVLVPRCMPFRTDY